MKTYKQKAEYYYQLSEQSKKEYREYIEKNKTTDPILEHKYQQCIYTMKEIFYTSNPSRPEWDIVAKTLRNIGEIE